jgi:alkyl sulfatase BDS1-like metallo-beta-lactamase superfamily hydrolase
MRDPDTVAAIVNVLRQVHGDDLARVMLNDGVSLAVLIDTLLRSPLKNPDAVKLISRALRSGDFMVTPEFGSPSHLKYYYDRPKSMHVVDIAVMTLHGTIASTDIRLRLKPSDN